MKTDQSQATKQPEVIDDKTMQMIRRELLKMPKHERDAVTHFLSVANQKQLMSKPTKPTREDLRFKQAMTAAQALDQELLPITEKITNYFIESLNERSKELFFMFTLLVTGETLSMFAPRHLATCELNGMGSIRYYRSKAAKAQKLLKALGTRKSSRTAHRQPENAR